MMVSKKDKGNFVKNDDIHCDVSSGIIRSVGVEVCIKCSCVLLKVYYVLRMSLSNKKNVNNLY